MQLPEVRLLTLQFNLPLYAVASSAAFPSICLQRIEWGKGYQGSQKLYFIATKGTSPDLQLVECPMFPWWINSLRRHPLCTWSGSTWDYYHKSDDHFASPTGIQYILISHLAISRREKFPKASYSSRALCKSWLGLIRFTSVYCLVSCRRDPGKRLLPTTAPLSMPKLPRQTRLATTMLFPKERREYDPALLPPARTW